MGHKVEVLTVMEEEEEEATATTMVVGKARSVVSKTNLRDLHTWLLPLNNSRNHCFLDGLNTLIKDLASRTITIRSMERLHGNGLWRSRLNLFRTKKQTLSLKRIMLQRQM